MTKWAAMQRRKWHIPLIGITSGLRSDSQIGGTDSQTQIQNLPESTLACNLLSTK